MNEKLAMSDILCGVNSLITMLEYAIEQSNNKSFRDDLIASRNNLEQIQWEVYLICKEKGYYIPAAPAGQADIEQVKNIVCKS